MHEKGVRQVAGSRATATACGGKRRVNNNDYRDDGQQHSKGSWLSRRRDLFCSSLAPCQHGFVRSASCAHAGVSGVRCSLPSKQPPARMHDSTFSRRPQRDPSSAFLSKSALAHLRIAASRTVRVLAAAGAAAPQPGAEVRRKRRVMEDLQGKWRAFRVQQQSPGCAAAAGCVLRFG